MKAHIFAEGSNTTAGDEDLPLTEYYEGLFGMVVGLHEDLSEFADTRLHVLSEDFGIADGNTKKSEMSAGQQPSVGFDEMIREGREALLDATENGDVVVVLLSTDVFQQLVTTIWDEIVDTAQPGSIWCFGAAQSALQELDPKQLASKDCTVLTYQRVGVARIGTETREELLDVVKQKATQ